METLERSNGWNHYWFLQEHFSWSFLKNHFYKLVHERPFERERNVKLLYSKPFEDLSFQEYGHYGTSL